MAWALIGKPKTQKVTKALAKSFAEMEPAPHDRQLSERRLMVYQRLLKEGSFRPVTWASAICKETGGVYRVNGKHTSVMLSGLEDMPDFYVTIEEYECDTLEDIARLYSTFDSKMMSRTTRDINLSFAATLPALAGVAARSINSAVAGITYHLGTYFNTQSAERAEVLLEYPEFVIWLDELIGSDAKSETRGSSKHLVRQGCVAAMFGTWQKSKTAANEFWTAVRDETGTSPNLPDRKLARYLLGTGHIQSRGVYRSHTADLREFYVKCLHAWNAWRKGETTALQYYPNAKLPSIR